MKTLQNTIAIVALTTLLFSSNLFAQDAGDATAEVKIQLKRGLSISNQGSTLINFGDVVVTTSAQTPEIEEGNGAHFLVTGQPYKDVTISFIPVTLNNNAWVGVNGGTQSTMTFTPAMEETGSTSAYPGSGTLVATGDAVELVNVSGIGNLNLWVGGEMAIDANQAHGDYTGTLTVSVAY